MGAHNFARTAGKPGQTATATQPVASLERACSCGGHGHSTEGCTSCRSGGGLIQRCAENGDPGCACGVDEVLHAPGRPLEADLRGEMGRRFGTDFSRVRVHTDAGAAATAARLNARAYTVGNDIVFAAGRYAPHSADGRRLLAHELTHVVQQSHGPIGAGASGVSSPGSPLEHEAHSVADRVLGGQDVRGQPTRAPGGQIARDAAPRRASGGRRGGGVTQVDINCADKTIHFNGPRAHTWQLSECDLSDGDYDATVEVQHHPITKVNFRLRNAPEGTRFRFGYRVMGNEASPDELVRAGQSVRVHATSAPTTGAGAQSGDQAADQGRTTFHVAVLGAAGFEQATGVSADRLPEGRIVDGSGFRFSPGVGFGASRAPYPFPRNTTGVLWTGQHMSDVAVVNGHPTVRGFRAGFGTHALSFAEREAGIFGGSAGDATHRLNRGTAGTYASDYWYLYSPDARLVHRGPVDQGVAERGAQMIEGAAGRYNQEYRFSPPPQGTPAYERLSGGNPDYVCLPGQNCINVPVREHTEMLGGRRMTINPDNPLDITTGRSAATGEMVEMRTPSGRGYSGPGYARNADTWAANPGEGLVSTPTFRGMMIRGVLRVGGRVILIYGIHSTATRIAGASDDQKFEVAVEEGGSWLGGWLGSVIGSAIGGAVVCSETGPGAVICAGGFAIAGGLTGSVIGADLARDAAIGARNVGDLLRDPVRLNEAAVQMFGTDEEKRRYYEDRERLEELGF